MLPLLRFTRDLFEPFQPQGQSDRAPLAPELVSNRAPNRVDTGSAPSFRHPRASRECRLGPVLVAYAFARSTRRSIGFSVGPDGLSVRAPKWVSLSAVDAALQAKSAWILRKLQETSARQARLPTPIDWRDGVTLPYLGQPLTLRLDPEHRLSPAGAHAQFCTMMAADGSPTACLALSLPQHASAVQIRDAAQAWLMRQARANFVARLDHFAAQLGVTWRKLSLSQAQSRWGSARSDGSIRLNWRLMHFSQAIIDYVVVHELSHLRVMNHSPQFWHTVGKVLPDYALQRQALKSSAVAPWD